MKYATPPLDYGGVALYWGQEPFIIRMRLLLIAGFRSEAL